LRCHFSQFRVPLPSGSSVLRTRVARSVPLGLPGILVARLLEEPHAFSLRSRAVAVGARLLSVAPTPPMDRYSKLPVFYLMGGESTRSATLRMRASGGASGHLFVSLRFRDHGGSLENGFFGRSGGGRAPFRGARPGRSFPRFPHGQRSVFEAAALLLSRLAKL